MSSKKGRGQRYAQTPCERHLFPRPIEPQPLRSLIGGSLADSVGLHVCHIGSHSHLSFDRLDDLDNFSYSATRDAIPGPFVSSNPHPLPVLRLNQQHLPSLRNPPSTSSRAISACHGRHVSDPSQSDLLV